MADTVDTAASDLTNSQNYVVDHLPPDIIERLESGVFRSLRQHLQERSDQVQNLDLMTVSGFCRNCLAKWFVAEARKLSDSIQQSKSIAAFEECNGVKNNDYEFIRIIQSLDSIGYDEAAQYIYGMTYPGWKKRHVTKVSDEKMERFNSSKSLWAKHDKQLLSKRNTGFPSRIEKGTAKVCTVSTASNQSPGNSNAVVHLLSNVCCEDIDNENITTSDLSLDNAVTNTNPIQIPAVTFSIGILTISDRAHSGEYEDLSGPTIQKTVQSIISKNNTHGTVISRIETAIVPDEMDDIKYRLLSWSSTAAVARDSGSTAEELDVIITTGGTGFSSRDVTPEATKDIVDRTCEGLMSYCLLKCANHGIQPLASLSRGIAGVKNNTLILNLPGNPKAANEILPMLLPLSLFALADMKN